jgi:hypothetical protein
LFGTGAGVKQGKAPLTTEQLQKVVKAHGKLPLAEVLRCRLRYFTDGVVLGGKAFVAKYIAEFVDGRVEEDGIGAGADAMRRTDGGAATDAGAVASVGAADADGGVRGKGKANERRREPRPLPAITEWGGDVSTLRGLHKTRWGIDVDLIMIKSLDIAP